MTAPPTDGADDEADFTEWVRARQGALLRTAYLLTGDRHAAEDLVQSTLARVYLSWRRIQRHEAIDGYARRVMVNLNTSQWRRLWRHREVLTQRPPDAAVHDLHDDGVADQLREVILGLPPRQRAVVVLRYYEQLSEAEIAEAMGISRGTVKSQSSKALRSMRAALPDEESLR